MSSMGRVSHRKVPIVAPLLSAARPEVGPLWLAGVIHRFEPATQQFLCTVEGLVILMSPAEVTKLLSTRPRCRCKTCKEEFALNDLKCICIHQGCKQPIHQPGGTPPGALGPCSVKQLFEPRAWYCMRHRIESGNTCAMCNGPFAHDGSDRKRCAHKHCIHRYVHPACGHHDQFAEKFCCVSHDPNIVFNA